MSSTELKNEAKTDEITSMREYSTVHQAHFAQHNGWRFALENFPLEGNLHQHKAKQAGGAIC